VLDIKLIRDNPEFVRNNLLRRGNPKFIEMFDKLIEFDKEWRKKLTNLNELRHERRLITLKIAEIKKAKGKADEHLEKAKKIDNEIELLEDEVKKSEEKINYFLMRLPNLLHESVPFGKDETENQTVKVWGKPPQLNFPIKNHIDLGLNLNIIDIERAAKIAGARFYYMKNEGVLLDMALTNFALNELRKKGYTPIWPPLMMHRKPYEGVTELEAFEDMLYKIENEDLFLISTSEHPIAAMFMDETLNKKDLPLKFVGISTCFRKEAGAHGKDTRGMFRTHQFNKVEQFIFSLPEQSWDAHEELLRNAEELIQSLGLPYRVTNVCTGDIGIVAAKKYDIEAWMPAQGQYREIISCSNCTDYQARRLNIKYREKEGEPPRGYVHTLNSTAIATGRTIVAILENYQQEDGSVVIPEVLRPYMNGIERIAPH